MASSLEILRPTPSHRTNLPRPQTSRTAHDLETRSIAVSRALSLNDHSHPDLIRHLSSDFVNEDVNISRAARDSCVGVQVISVSANVDEERGRASVWLLMGEKDKGKGGLSGENVSVLSWWRERGQWRCYKQSGMRGVSGFPQWYRN